MQILIFLLIPSWFLLTYVNFPPRCFASGLIILCKLCQQCVEDNMNHRVCSWAPRVQLRSMCLNLPESNCRPGWSQALFQSVRSWANTGQRARYITEELKVSGDTWVFTPADPHSRKWNNSSQLRQRKETAEFLFFSTVVLIWFSFLCGKSKCKRL